jgi:RNA polymerase sigma-70 factor (ECF subfamily)
MLSTIEDEQERLKIADIYDEHRHKCLHIALGITKNQQTAEDAVQDAFVEVIKRKDKILSMDCNHLLSYLVIIVKHKAIDILRKRKRISDIAFDELEDDLKAPDISVDEQVISKIGFERLVALIAGLDEKYKTIFEMRYILNYSNKEIAEMLNISHENVKVRLHRARAKLKKLLGSEVEVNV